MNGLPPKPWHTVHVDFCGPFPAGEYILVVIDAYSRFPEVEIVKSTSAASTIAKFERVFATHWLPNIIKSDNGPPFNSNDTKQDMTENEIEHQCITPQWPQANPEAENFMKPMEKAIRAARIEKKKNGGKNCLAFYQIIKLPRTQLRNFHQLNCLFNRKIDIKLPSNIMTQDTKMDKQVRENDRNGKEKMKANADKFHHAKEHTLYNNYSDTRNLIGQYPCRMRQSCTGNLRAEMAGRIYQILMGLNCRQKTFKLLKLTENEEKVNCLLDQ